MAEAIQIVDFETSSRRPSLNLAAVKRIIKSRGTQNLPTIVVSIGGVARSGKSFLLNLFVHFLHHVEKKGTHVGWETSTEIINGINWAKSKTAVTRGIWMWSTPFKIKRRDGSEVAVLLVDSQGTGDNRMSDPKLDTQIMYISLELSCFQLLNINQYLTSTELTSLQLCTDYADLGPAQGGASSSKQSFLFENLMFVVRNYQSDDIPHGEDKNLFNEILDEGKNEGLLRAVRGIKRAFRKITSYTLPYPGSAIAGASVDKKEWMLADIPTDFIRPTKDLCLDLFNNCHRNARDIPTGLQLLERFEFLKFRLESADLPDIGTPADALQESILTRAYTKTTTAYATKLQKFKSNFLQYQSEDVLQQAFHSMASEAMAMFNKEAHQEKYGRSKIWSKYLEYLENKFEEDVKTTVILYTGQKKMADLAEQNRQIQLRYERKQRENTEKQKQLERETIAMSSRLSETMRQSEQRETANREQLAKVMEDMRNAREEDRAFNERQAERYQTSIEQEQEARQRAEQLHNDQVRGINEHLDRMTREFEAKEDARKAELEEYKRQAEGYQRNIVQEQEARQRAEQLHNEQVQKINENLGRLTRESEAKEKARQAELDEVNRKLKAERNKPAPQPPKKKGWCSIM